MAKKRILSVFVAVLCLSQGAVLSQGLPTTHHPVTDGWKDLFRTDLSNALYEPGTWVMEDGVLYAEDRGTIWTREKYGDFILDLEFKVEKDANSGVFLRAGDIKDALSAIEVQVHETGDGKPLGVVGAIYDLLLPRKNMAKPAGEWNRYTITCDDNKIYLVFNSKQVIDMDLDQWTEPHKNPDGTLNKFARALKDYARSGPVGFQGIHGRGGHRVWYRKIKIKPIR